MLVLVVCFYFRIFWATQKFFLLYWDSFFILGVQQSRWDHQCGVRPRSRASCIMVCFFLSDSILMLLYFYHTLSCWCNSLNKKAQKELYERRQQHIWDKDVFFFLKFCFYFLGSTTIQWVREFSLNTIEMVESPCQGV